MKIVIDGIIFQLQHGRKLGISGMWDRLIPALLKQPNPPEIIMLNRKGYSADISNVKNIEIPTFDVAKAANACCFSDEASRLTYAICEREKADIFMSTYYTTVGGDAKSVSFIHDMIPETFGFDMTYWEWAYKQYDYYHTDHIITVSNSTKHDLVDVLADGCGCQQHGGCLPPITTPITTVYPGIDTNIFKPKSSGLIDKFKKDFNIIKPYYMIVGNRNVPYRNGKRCFHAFSAMSNKKDYQIFATGEKQPIYPEEMPYVDGCYYTAVPYLSTEEMAIAYSGAVALVYPSFKEGFSIPMLEAMACGCPIITSKIPSAYELVGDAALFCDPLVVGEITNAMEQVQNNEIRNKLVDFGLKRSYNYSMDKMAKEVLDVLKTVVAN